MGKQMGGRRKGTAPIPHEKKEKIKTYTMQKGERKGREKKLVAGFNRKEEERSLAEELKHEPRKALGKKSACR